MKNLRFRIVVGGVLFSVVKLLASEPELVASFDSTNGAITATLAMGPEGNFYGTAAFGGAGPGDPGYGTVFKLTPDGVLTSLFSFSPTNGYRPNSRLRLGEDGSFYGTTAYGGSNDGGTVFKVTTNGLLTTLLSFNRLHYGTNGTFPNGLVLGNDGNFYGTTYEGGSSNAGTVFKMTANGVLTTLVSFQKTNGANPTTGLVVGRDGSLYGTTEQGGSAGAGTVFKVTKDGVLSMLFSFGGTNGGFPYGELLLGPDGDFYGTTGIGNGNYGTLFRVTSNGVFTTLVYFDGSNGAMPQGPLVWGRDGNLYGTTSLEGITWSGTVFQLTTNGMLTTLTGFSGVAGYGPYELVLGRDGNFYGAASGGAYKRGTIFRLVTAPKVGAVTIRSGGVFLSGSGLPNNAYRLWATTDLSLPFPAWTFLTSNSFDTNGNFSFLDAGAATSNSRFYRLSVP